MTLANMLIYHGSELCTADGPEAVRKINEQAADEARKFINKVEPPTVTQPPPDLSNVKEYRSA